MTPKNKEKKRIVITPDGGEHHHDHSGGHHGHTHSPGSGVIEIALEENFMERNKALAKENLE
ncbi:MAG: hypothetical protein ACFFAL_04300, partial [Promethearchaeota archaeon]